MMSIIVATDTRGAIGEGNKIPWRIKTDLIRLAQKTRNHTVILGRKSYDSMAWYYTKSGKSLPGAQYIVVTRNTAYKPQHANAQVAHSIAEAIEIGKKIGDEEILVIGGGTIYSAMLPYVKRIYLTEVQTTVASGDAYFPKLNKTEWHEVSREHFNDDRDDYKSEFITYERI